MTRTELTALCVQIRLMKAKSARLDRVKTRIEALRDAATLPTTKALYNQILELFDED